MSVLISASKRVVKVGQKFTIRVVAAEGGPFKVTSGSWSGQNTGNTELDKEHDIIGHQKAPPSGKLWGPFSIDKPGTYTFTVKGTSEFLGKVGPQGVITQCHLEVREDTTYFAQVDWFKDKFGMSAEWQAWMKSDEIHFRYVNAWARARAIPTMVRLALRYGGDPVKYDPPWKSESQHMDELNKFAALCFPGLGIAFEFNADPFITTPDGPTVLITDGLVEVRGEGKTSNTDSNSKKIYLYFEPIFRHEFGHFLNILHHYDDGDPKLTPKFMPPFETTCTMARNGDSYCSGCRAAMHIGQITVDESKQLAAIVNGINKRYPKE